jgi:hypothetical protein
VAISPFIVGKQKREIASQARNDNTKKPGDLGCPRLAGRKERLLCRKASCHREGRSDLGFLGRPKQKREIAALCSQTNSVIARDEAISVF